MEIPNLRKGHLYPSAIRARCPIFHACVATKKCQNYNRHCFTCVQCESRVRPQQDLGGYLPEGTYFPDLQHSITVMQTLRGKWADMNGETDSFKGTDITNKYSNMREATDKLNHFTNAIGATMTDKVIGTYMHKHQRPMLGRLS